ncbi:MAG TPA: aquaporin [Solirubrobacteraceae bacterium]|nr:aquaporin [Solirubrobacteraceae bacterium]
MPSDDEHMPDTPPVSETAPVTAALLRRASSAEVAGTSLLVLVAAGGPTIAATGNGPVERLALVIAPGLTVTALIYALGAISGAHFNPVVTMAFALRGDFPWRWVPRYAAAQLAGGLLACVFLRVMFGVVGHLGATEPGPRATDAQALFMEVVLTAILVLVILGTASGARNVGHNSALAVGGFIAAAGLFASTISGSSLNPARSLAPALVSGRLSTVWIYLVGPSAGAIAAAFAVLAIGGRPTRSEREAALGERLV